MNKKSRVLITGGAGFIGSSLANKLSGDFEVTAVDNLTSGDWGRVSAAIKIVELDLVKASFQEICDLVSGMDYVYQLAAVKLHKAEAAKGRFEYVIARLFFIYGPNQFADGGYKSVIVNNFERLLLGEPAIVNGSGNQVLDYLYIDDCVNYLAALMESNFIGPVNVSSGQGVSILDLVSQMIDAAGSGTIEFASEDWTSGSTRIGDKKLLLEMFPDIKKTPLQKGLENTLNDVRFRIGQA